VPWLTTVKRGYIGTVSEPAPELPAESEALTGVAENARRGVVTHITVNGERVAAIVPESLVKLLNDLVSLLATDLSGAPHCGSTSTARGSFRPESRTLNPGNASCSKRSYRQA
jgi:hypothetical protein